MKKLVLKPALAAILLCLSAISIHAVDMDTLVVTKISDPNPFTDQYNFVDSLCDPDMYGTLQWAIRKANDSPGPCIIVFNIAGTGPYVIFLNQELPPFHNQITLDGTTQTGYLTGAPAIIIHGQDRLGTGLNIDQVDNCIVKGLQIRNILNWGIFLYWCHNYTLSDNIMININNGGNTLATTGLYIAFSYNGLITGNTIGTDNTEIIQGIENFGILVASGASDNTIGGTQPGLGNKITNCGQRGIIVFQDCNNNRISGNIIYNNPVGIFLATDANMNKQSPVITGFTGNTVTGTSQPGDIIEVFGSTGPENANEYLTTVTADGAGNWSATITNFSWQYVIATATDGAGNTSVLSAPVEMQAMPGTTCNNAIELIVKDSCESVTFPVEEKIWFSFIASDSIIDMRIEPLNSNVSLFTSDCANLIDISETMIDFRFYSLSVNQKYYIKITGENENVTICLKSSPCEGGYMTSSDCIIIGGCNKVYNGDFDSYTPDDFNVPNWDYYTFSDNRVDGWGSIFGTPDLCTGCVPPTQAHLYSRSTSESLYAEGIVSCVNLQTDKMYFLEYDYFLSPMGGNLCDNFSFEVCLTDATTYESYYTCNSNYEPPGTFTFDTEYNKQVIDQLDVSNIEDYFHSSKSFCSTEPWERICMFLFAECQLAYPREIHAYINTVKVIPIIFTNKTICKGESVELKPTCFDQITTTGHTFSWTPATGLSSTTILNPVASPLENTTYYLFIDQWICPVAVTVNVTQIYTDFTFNEFDNCEDKEVPFTISGVFNPGSGVLSFGDGTSVNYPAPTIDPPTIINHIYSNPGYYTVTMTPSNICFAAKSKIIYIIPSTQSYNWDCCFADFDDYTYINHEITGSNAFIGQLLQSMLKERLQLNLALNFILITGLRFTSAHREKL
ncbi:MAG: right-handed parallel beta-helix repeat-containing protein [Bacteroidia bacterium]|nr:right-handed parallel beta-helix repeat-containing protein [Bacteroidia bacterium]